MAATLAVLVQALPPKLTAYRQTRLLAPGPGEAGERTPRILPMPPSANDEEEWREAKLSGGRYCVPLPPMNMLPQ